MTDNSEFVFPESNIVDLFAGIPVSDQSAAIEWYEKLLGCPPTFIASDDEAVWDLRPHCSIFIERDPAHAGNARHSIFLSELDEFVDDVTKRGIEPIKRETYQNGVRKVNYKDPDGNEIGFGGAPKNAS